MHYYRLFDDMSMRQRHRWHVGEIFLPDGTEPWLSGGIRLDNLEPLRAEVHHVGHILTFCHTSFNVPIATHALADAIRKIAEDDVQCIPVTISDQRGMMVLNALRVIQCVHELESKFVKWTEHNHRPDKTGDYRYFDKLVLARQAIPQDAHFFRLKGYLIHLVVSETVKNAMERVGCYGAEFTELELA